MRILLVAPDPWLHPIPYHMCPLRVARTLSRFGHELYCIDMYGDPYGYIGFQNEPPNVLFNNGRWMAVHAVPSTYFNAITIACEIFNPDLVYVFGWTNGQRTMNFLKGKNIPFGLHRADPFYEAQNGKVIYPSRDAVNIYKQANFHTFNEGQAWNYMYQHGLGDKAILLSHAIDPELAPTRNEVIEADKKYLCSMVMGGEDPYRKIEFLKYYYQWTDHFPDETFISGGGTYYAMKWKIGRDGSKQPNDITLPYLPEDLESSDRVHSTPEDISRYSGRFFNVTKTMDYDCETFPQKKDPQVLCHKFIHRLYRDSLYGFTPYGWYITHGPQSEYQVGPLGTKTTEMGGSGAAMIANWINDIEVLIQDGKTGFVFEKPESARTVFQYAIDNPDDVRRMGLAAYDYIHENHSWDVRYEQVLKPLFKELGLL